MGSLRELQVVGTGHHGRHKVVSPGRFAHVEISFCRPSAMTNGHPTWSIASTYPGSLVALQRGVYATKSPGSFFGGPGKMTSISLWCLGTIQNCGLPPVGPPFTRLSRIQPRGAGTTPSLGEEEKRHPSFRLHGGSAS